MRLATRAILAASETDEPPNFWTMRVTGKTPLDADFEWFERDGSGPAQHRLSDDAVRHAPRAITGGDRGYRMRLWLPPSASVLGLALIASAPHTQSHLAPMATTPGCLAAESTRSRAGRSPAKC